MPPPVKPDDTENIQTDGVIPGSNGSSAEDQNGSPNRSGNRKAQDRALREIRQEIRGLRKDIGALKKQNKWNSKFQEIQENSRVLGDRISGRQEEHHERLQQLQQKMEELFRLQGESREADSARLEEMQREIRAEFPRVIKDQEGIGKQVQEIREELIQQGQILTLLKGEADRNARALKENQENSSGLLSQLQDQKQRLERQAEQDRTEEARARNNQGVVLYYRGTFEAAAKLISEAIALKPDYPEAYNNLGLTYSRMNRSEEAVQAFQKAIELDPAMAEVYNNLGFHFHTKLKFDQAIEMFRIALHRQGDFSEAYSNLGNSLYRLRQHDKALGAWKRALEIDPMNRNAQRSLRMFDQKTGDIGKPDSSTDIADGPRQK